MLRFLAFSALLSVAFGEDSENWTTKVKHVTDAEWADYKEANSKFLMLMYAPWCGHCKAAKPHFGDVAADEEVTMPLAAADCTGDAKDICQEYEVNSYPTIKYFENGDASDYNSSRDVKGFKSFVMKKIDPNWKPAPTGPFVNKPEWDEDSGDVVFMDDEHFDEFRSENPSFLAFFYAPWCGHCKAAKPEYGAASLKVNVPMLAADCTGTGSGTCNQFDVSGFPTIMWFDSAAHDEPVKYEGGRKEKDFVKFLKKKDPNYEPGPFENIVPAEWEESGKVVHMTDDHFDWYRAKTPRFLAFFYAPWCGHCKKAKPDFAVASNKFRRSMPFVAMDCTSDGSETCSKFEVKSFPTLRYFEGPEGEPQDPGFQGALTSGDFITFVEKKLDALTSGDDVDISKLRVKQLRKMLKDRGVKCRGCTEKAHFVDRVKETMHLAKKSEDEGKKKGPRKSLMQEKREKALAKAAEKGWSEESYGNGAVIHSYDGHFDSLLQGPEGKEGFLAFFYAPWCGHCKSSKPEIVAVSEKLKELGSPHKMVAIDAEGSKELALQFKIKSFPTYHFFQNNEMNDQVYNDAGAPRGKKTILKFMMQLSDPDWAPEPAGPFVNEERWEKSGKVVFMDDDHFEDYRKGDEAKDGFMAFFYAPWCGHCKAAKPHYADASEETKTPMLAMDCTDFGQETCQKFGVNSYPTIKWFAQGEEPEDFNGARDKSGFADFCNERGDPNYVKPPPGPFVNKPEWDDDSGDVIFMDDDHFDEFQEENERFLAFFYAPWCGHCKAAKPHFGKASLDVDIPLVAMDCTGNGKKTCNENEVTGFPTIKWFEKGAEPMKYQQARSQEGFVSFINDKVKAAIAKEEL